MAGERLTPGRHPLLDAFVNLIGQSPEALLERLRQEPAARMIATPFEKIAGLFGEEEVEAAEPQLARLPGDRIGPGSPRSTQEIMSQFSGKFIPGSGRGDIELPDESVAPTRPRLGRVAPKSKPVLPSGNFDMPPTFAPDVEGEPPFPLDSENFEQGMGMAPDVSTEAVSALLPDQRPFEERHPLWASFLQGMNESLVPAVVSFASKYSDNPQMVEAWAQQEANRLFAERMKAERELEILKMFNAEAEAQREYQMQILNARNTFMKTVVDIGSNEKMPPMAKATALRAFMPYGALLGYDAQTMSHMVGQVVQPQFRESVREQYEAWLKNTQIFAPDDPRLTNSRPISIDGDPRNNWTAEQAAKFLGMVDEDGTVIPHVSEIETVDFFTRDSSGTEYHTTLPKAATLGKTAVRARSPQAGDFETVVIPGEHYDEHVTFSTTGAGGPISRTRLPRGTAKTPGLLGSVSDLKRDDVRQFLRSQGIPDSDPDFEENVSDIASTPEKYAVVERWKRKRMEKR